MDLTDYAQTLHLKGQPQWNGQLEWKRNGRSWKNGMEPVAWIEEWKKEWNGMES